MNRAQGAGTTTTKSEKRSANTLYQELSFQDDNFDNEENEITGIVHPGEYASSGKRTLKNGIYFVVLNSKILQNS